MITLLILASVMSSSVLAKPFEVKGRKEICALKKKLASLQDNIDKQQASIAEQNNRIQRLNDALDKSRSEVKEILTQIEGLQEENSEQWEVINNIQGNEKSEDWIEYGGFQFLFVDTQLIWKDALNFCIQRKGHLAEPSDAKIDAFLGPKTAKETKQYWIGGSDYHSEGIWHWWSTGDVFTHTNWLKGEPNDGAGGVSEDCVLYNWAGLGKWADAPCKWKRSFICSRK